MIDKLTVKDISKKWHITERRICTLCKEGKIRGAEKIHGEWRIPGNAEKPMDQRIKNGKFLKKDEISFLPLPVGISNYRLLSTEYYYVDKTMMIKEFLDERPMVSLFTRPRRFGKTLNMDMLRTFFEISEEDTSIYFKDKKIWSYGKKYQEYQGKYPVIYISLKDMKHQTWEDTLEGLTNIISSEYKRHKNIKLDFDDQTYFDKILTGTCSEIDLEASLLKLSTMLNNYYNQKVVIIIDEYDTPIQSGYLNGFYDKIILFMRNFLSYGLKDNNNLAFGFLTGILRVSKESVFSGLNNLVINSVMDNKYSEYFGFTSDEVKDMAKYYNASNKYDEIIEWYDGYVFGDNHIFNPWSVINYFRNGCQPRCYWQSTGNNEIIGEILCEANEDIFNHLSEILQNKNFITYIDTSVIYPQVKNNPTTIYSFLLMAGYLKIGKIYPTYNGDFMCEVSIPNKEIQYIYNKEILQRLSNIMPVSIVISIQEALFRKDVRELSKSINYLLINSVSYFDTIGENFYHGFILGLLSTMDNRYFITSNRESGIGKYDICLEPKHNDLPGIIIELKSEKNCTKDELKRLAHKAITQINEKKYDSYLVQKGITDILKFGVAFSGKNVEIEMA